MARPTLQDSNKKLLETLQVNSEVLDNIQDGFKTIAHEENLTVHSFQEARGMIRTYSLEKMIIMDQDLLILLPNWLDIFLGVQMDRSC